MAVNEDKKQALYIRPDRTEPNEHSIRWINEACYLGIHTDAKLTWTAHINKLKRRGFIATTKPYSLLSSTSLNNKFVFVKQKTTYYCTEELLVQPLSNGGELPLRVSTKFSYPK